MDTKVKSRYREYIGGWNLWMKVLEASLLCDSFCFGGWWLSFLYISAFQPRNSLHACPNTKPVIFTLNNSNQASWACPWTPSNAMLIPNPSKRHIWSHHSPATNGSLIICIQYSSTVLFKIYPVSSLPFVNTVLPVRESLICPTHPLLLASTPSFLWGWNLHSLHTLWSCYGICVPD